MKLPLIKDIDVREKRVLLRLDLDVPLLNGEIDDDTRLAAALPTLEYLLKHNAKIIICGHLGRPSVAKALEGKAKEFSLEPVAKWLSIKYKIVSIKYGKRGEFGGWEIGEKLFLLENLRFYTGEEKNDPEFSRKLANLADIYVNDAFAMCHRKHASIVGVTHFLPHFAGFHLQKEVETLSQVMDNPKRPLVVIIGGKKIETKLPLVEKMHRIADYVLVGGKIAEEQKVLLKVAHEKIPGRKSVLLVADSNHDSSDITEKDAENFSQIIALSETIIWNGSMGIIDQKSKIPPESRLAKGGKNQKLDSEAGTKKIAESILKTKAYTVVGGGDTTEYLNKLGILNKFSFASTGGGAMLAFLSEKNLPGIQALTK